MSRMMSHILLARLLVAALLLAPPAACSRPVLLQSRRCLCTMTNAVSCPLPPLGRLLLPLGYPVPAQQPTAAMP